MIGEGAECRLWKNINFERKVEHWRLIISWHFNFWICVSLGECYSYQTVTVDYEGKLSRDVVHEVVGGWRWRWRALQLFPSCCCCCRRCAISLLPFSEPVAHETRLCPSLHPLPLLSISAPWQHDHPVPRPPGGEDRHTRHQLDRQRREDRTKTQHDYRDEKEGEARERNRREGRGEIKISECENWLRAGWCQRYRVTVVMFRLLIYLWCSTGRRKKNKTGATVRRSCLTFEW